MTLQSEALIGHLISHASQGGQISFHLPICISNSNSSNKGYSMNSTTTETVSLVLACHADMVKRFSCCSDKTSEWGRSVICDFERGMIVDGGIRNCK